MGFKTIAFEGYLTITHIDCEYSIDFGRYRLSHSDDAGDGMHVQRFIADEDSKGNLVRYIEETGEMATITKTIDAVAALDKARREHPYLKTLNKQATQEGKIPLKTATLGYSQNFGSQMNFSCLRGDFCRPTMDAASFLSEVTINKCSLCGGDHDPFERFFASVSHCWKTPIWEGPMWQTLGARSNWIDFPGVSNDVTNLDLGNLFLSDGAQVLDLRVTNNGPNEPEISADEYMKNGSFAVISEGTIEAINRNINTLCHVYFLPYPNGSGDVVGRFGLSVDWLEKEHVVQNYPLFLALQAFSEHRLEVAATFAWASFEKAFKLLESSQKKVVGKQEWDNRWTKHKVEEQERLGSAPSFWKYVMNLALEIHELVTIDEISPSFCASVRKLSKERQVVHTGKPTVSQREEMFKLVCAGIFGTKLCYAIGELEDTTTYDQFIQRLSMQTLQLELKKDAAAKCSPEVNLAALDLVKQSVKGS